MNTKPTSKGTWLKQLSPGSALPLLGGFKHARPVAADLLADAARRLQILALVMLGLWIVDLIWAAALFKMVQGTRLASLLPQELTTEHIIAIVGGFLLSVSLYVVARSGRFSPERLLDLAIKLISPPAV